MVQEPCKHQWAFPDPLTFDSSLVRTYRPASPATVA
jgi:hypothetical protein